MKLILKRSSILLLITLVAGLMLALVNALTADRIREVDEAARQQALAAAFPGAATMTAVEEDYAAMLEEQGITGVSVNAVYRVRGGTDGLLLDLTCHEAYAGDLRLAIGIDADGVSVGISILSMNETAGLGANCTKPSFLSGFVGLSDQREIEAADGITAATYTTNAVKKAAAAGMNLARALREGGAVQ